MNRRGFLRNIALGIGGIALEQAVPLGRVWSFPKKIVIADPLYCAYGGARGGGKVMKQFAGFDVGPDGVLSLHGQSVFPVYDANGAPTTYALRYRLEDGTVKARPLIHAFYRGDLPRYGRGVSMNAIA